MTQSDYDLKRELGFDRALIVTVLESNRNRDLTASEILDILQDYFQTLSSINYHLNWLVRNTEYVQKFSIDIGKIKRHTYKYKG